jgi:hypothetical protein
MKLRRKTKRIFTAALAFWLSGIVILFCCGNMPAKTASAETESYSPEKKGHCTKTAATEDSGYSFKKQPSFDGCFFPAKIFDKVRKLEKSPETSRVAETIEIAAPKFLTFEKSFEAPKFHRSFVRNRGSTHLQNCVFRI